MKKILALSVAAAALMAAGSTASMAQSLFDGGYVGATGGYTLYHAEPEDGAGVTAEIGADGFSGGAFAGWGTSFDGFYLGAELSGDVSNHEAAFGMTGVVEAEIVRHGGVGVSARAGFLPSESTLLFATAGIGTANYEASATDGTTTVTEEDWLNTYRIGAGVDTMVSENVFARVSYDMEFLNDDEFNGTDISNINAKSQTVKAGLGFRF